MNTHNQQLSIFLSMLLLFILSFFSSFGNSKNAASSTESHVAPYREHLTSREIATIYSHTGSGFEEIKTQEPHEMAEISDHQLFDELLTQYVDARGNVDYAGFRNELTKFEEYLLSLRKNAPGLGWPRDQKLAYWINAYNAFTIKLILDHFPVSSITEIENGKPWDKKWIIIGKETYSLNQIENEIIRPQFNEPRIHFAVNCAAKSCPPLANRAFTGANLEQMLEQQTQMFINDLNYNIISSSNAKISKIFDWYAEDFAGVNAFINKYSKVKLSSSVKLEFQDYNWDLNKQ